MVLEWTGGEVYAVHELGEAERILRDRRPDLLVLCYTLSRRERGAVLGAARRLRPGVKTLILKADGTPPTGEGDHDVFTGARAFAAKVAELLGQGSSAEQRA
jgi:hypothetical protein